MANLHASISKQCRHLLIPVPERRAKIFQHLLFCGRWLFYLCWYLGLLIILFFLLDRGFWQSSDFCGTIWDWITHNNHLMVLLIAAGLSIAGMLLGVIIFIKRRLWRHAHIRQVMTFLLVFLLYLAFLFIVAVVDANDMMQEPDLLPIAYGITTAILLVYLAVYPVVYAIRRLRDEGAYALYYGLQIARAHRCQCAGHRTALLHGASRCCT